MRHLLLLGLALGAARAPAQTQTPRADVARWERRARSVTIIRDDWGIAHVYGHTDADAVFGAEYAQA
ncbi:MAG: penicillin acylase family protein, partial [Gemmatimonadales bacterium]